MALGRVIWFFVVFFASMARLPDGRIQGFLTGGKKGENFPWTARVPLSQILTHAAPVMARVERLVDYGS